ncbi:MAG: phage tail sheath family protein [Clostridia bacterium]|nr:phage tail sheath family protein [Clostridia bacterium]
MAFGGGTFTAQDKKLPGSYINFITVKNAVQTIFGRGVAAMGLQLDWGADDEVFTVTAEEFFKNARALFGYKQDAPQMKALRDIFKNAHTLRAYRLNGGGKKAENSFATAACSGTRGNAITIAVAKNADDASKWDVKTYMDGELVDLQTVAAAAELKQSAYCIFKAEAALAENAGEAMTGGENGSVTAESHQKFIDLVQSYSFNAIGAVSDETGEDAPAVNDLYAAFTRRMRDEMGVKFQCVLFRNAADHEGVISVQNAVKDEGWSAASLVYWITGLMAGTAVGQSAMNTVYDGEFSVDASYTQAQLEGFIDSGCMTLHRVNDELRLLNDVNSLVSFTESKGEIFRQNQVIRVIDAAAGEIASVFNTKYIGKVPNSASGRVSLWADIVKIFRDLERVGAIEGFDESTVTVQQGEQARSVMAQVSAVNVAGAMEKLYMTIVIA